MTPQQKRRLTLALNAYGQVRMFLGRELTARTRAKFLRRSDKAKAKVYAVVERILAAHQPPGANDRRCTCPASVDITFTGHLPGCGVYR